MGLAAYGLRFGDPGWGSGLDLAEPGCLRIFFMTCWSSMKEMTRICPWHLGQMKGFASYIFWMSPAQVFLYSLNDPPVRGWRVSFRPSHFFPVHLGNWGFLLFAWAFLDVKLMGFQLPIAGETGRQWVVPVSRYMAFTVVRKAARKMYLQSLLRPVG
jgi:hypothetical protein